MRADFPESHHYARRTARHRGEFVVADGWVLVGDRTVEVQGAACEQLRSFGAHSIEVEV